MTDYITKEDGEQEFFSKEKINRSLLRAGTDPEVASYIIGVIEKHLQQISKSKDIYNLVLNQLKRKQPAAAIKYTLKKAIMDLGPTGYIFEKYIAKILEEYGYKTEVGTMVKGFCVDHEIDVIAHKDKGHYMIECKYHNRAGTKSDVKTALYVHARFLDLQKASHNNTHDYYFTDAWLATNTKCTSEAIRYANCVKLNIMAWHYPEHKNLEYHIEKKKLYPISILPSLKKAQKELLYENNIYTTKDLLKASPDWVEGLLKINKQTSDKLFAMAAMLLT